MMKVTPEVYKRVHTTDYRSFVRRMSINIEFNACGGIGARYQSTVVWASHFVGLRCLASAPYIESVTCGTLGVSRPQFEARRPTSTVVRNSIKTVAYWVVPRYERYLGSCNRGCALVSPEQCAPVSSIDFAEMLVPCCTVHKAEYCCNPYREAREAHDAMDQSLKH